MSDETEISVTLRPMPAIVQTVEAWAEWVREESTRACKEFSDRLIAALSDGGYVLLVDASIKEEAQRALAKMREPPT